MDVTLRAIEVTGRIDDRHQLHLDEPLSGVGPSQVRVIILVPTDRDADEREWLQAAAANPAFGFLQDPAEDIYTSADGNPFNDAG